MTPPAIAKTPLVRPYAQLNAGVINYHNAPFSPSVTAEGGVKLKKDNWDAQVGVRVGTDVGAKVSAGYTLPISERGNAAVKFSAGGDYTRSLMGKSETTITTKVPGLEPHSISAAVTPDLYKGYAGVGINFHPSKQVGITIGAEGGVRGTTSSAHASQTLISEQNGQTHTIRSEVGYDKHVGAYATPKLGVEYTPNKNLTFGLNADLNEMGARVAWTF